MLPIIRPRPLSQLLPRGITVRSGSNLPPFRKPPPRFSGDRSSTLAEPRFRPDRQPTHLLTLADLSPEQISHLLSSALTFKLLCKHFSPYVIRKSMAGKTAALVFSKRSTRTRVASETSAVVLGGHPMFLGSQDIQLGVNETLADTAKVIGSMADGFMARVGAHSEVEVSARLWGLQMRQGGFQGVVQDIRCFHAGYKNITNTLRLAAVLVHFPFFPLLIPLESFLYDPLSHLHTLTEPTRRNSPPTLPYP